MNSAGMQENNQVFRKEYRRILHSGDAKGVAGICFNNSENWIWISRGFNNSGIANSELNPNSLLT